MKKLLSKLFKRGGDDISSSKCDDNMIFTHNCAARM